MLSQKRKFEDDKDKNMFEHLIFFLLFLFFHLVPNFCNFGSIYSVRFFIFPIFTKNRILAFSQRYIIA